MQLQHWRNADYRMRVLLHLFVMSHPAFFELLRSYSKFQEKVSPGSAEVGGLEPRATTWGDHVD